MIGYYTVIKELQEQLISDTDINTVVIGNIDNVDVNKQTIFPLAHIIVNNVSFPTMGFLRFNITLEVMDIVDEAKNNITDIAEAERWKGIDNKQDILNSMLAVIERHIKAIESGLDVDAQLFSRTVAEPFESRFENLLTGWDISYEIDIINTVQNC